MPFFGKSGTSRIRCLSWSAFRLELGDNLPCSFNAKKTDSGSYAGFGFFNRIDARSPRSLPQSRSQARDLIACSLRVNLHAAIGVVAYPAGDQKNVRFPFHEPAEAHSLHASANHKAASLNRFFSGGHAPKNVILSGESTSRTRR